MSLRPRLSVWGKLILFSTMLVLSTGIVLGTGFYGYAHAMARQHLEAYGAALASSLANQARPGVESRNVFRSLDGLAYAIAQQPHVARVRVLDADGRQLAQAARRGFAAELPLLRSVYSSAELLDRGAPNGPLRTIGTVELWLSLESLRANRRRMISFAINALGAVLIIGLIASLAVARRLTRPIEAIAEAAEAIARGEYGVLAPRLGDDELGELADSFNTMSRALAETRGYLDAIIDCTPVPLVVIDADGRLRRLNGSACALLGYPHGALRGARLEELFAAPHPFSGDTMDRLLRDGRCDEVAVRAIAEGGVPVPLRLAASLLKDQDGRAYGIVAMLDAYAEGAA